MSDHEFKPAWWLKNPHLQTIWPAVTRTGVKNLELQRERIELPDGDFIEIDWLGKNNSGPLVLILHGFEGSIESHYSKGMLHSIGQSGWRGAFIHFRGCSGVPNRLPRGYHSGETNDLDYVVKVLRAREKGIVLAGIGYSLGGNILLKWLGETGKDNPLKAAIAISVPFELNKAADKIGKGFSRFYEWYLIKCACDRLLNKFSQSQAPINPEILSKIQDIRDFDNKYTVPVHGFQSVDEYYNSCSSRRYLKTIAVPTLLIQAKDDPFMTADVIPNQDDLSDKVTLEVTERGGHVGFISGRYPWRPEYWLEERIPKFLRDYIK